MRKQVVKTMVMLIKYINSNPGTDIKNIQADTKISRDMAWMAITALKELNIVKGEGGRGRGKIHHFTLLMQVDAAKNVIGNRIVSEFES